MRRDAHATPHERIEQVVTLMRTKVAGSEQAALERFVREYFRQVDPEDLAERLPEDLYGVALSHWGFARRRPPGTAKLRVVNPTIEEHGWQSTHTVVQIINDDMPFLVDSVAMAVNRCGLTLHLIIHPIVTTKRDSSGHLIELVADDEGERESFMHVEADRITEATQLERLGAEINGALHDVRLAVADWNAMLAKVREILDETDRRPAPIPADELAEARAILEWLADNHFTFFGYRSYDLVRVNGEDGLRVVPGSGLGILRETDEKMSASFAALPPKLRERARLPELLFVTKANARSTVHRPAYLDSIGIRRFDARGEVCGEHRFLGLYTSAAYMAVPRDIPLLRRKVATVRERAQLPPQSHAGKALANILDTYPRDELFQIGTEELFDNALGILHLGERQRFRLFVRRDPFERFVSCLLYAPREHYNTAIRRKWQRILADAFNGDSSEFNVFLSESMLARILITVRTVPGALSAYDVRDIERRLTQAARRWEDDLQDALVAALGEARGNSLLREYAAAFPVSYREDFVPRSAVADIEMMASLSDARPLGLALSRPLEAAPGALRFKLFHRSAPVTLSDSLPMLERMGLTVLDDHCARDHLVPAFETTR
ncbi:MAG: hypothetical protein A3H35_12780 [Betaproteobacteria bacterium RIFCSPLOWO2_02_FULL_62_17]|nr:MAG: hypothetical protein A3H35_12780 [Betaproteobacteria bacterium RIFCSPLOWO2_02_FULL_62_17]